MRLGFFSITAATFSCVFASWRFPGVGLNVNGDKNVEFAGINFHIDRFTKKFFELKPFGSDPPTSTVNDNKTNPLDSKVYPKPSAGDNDDLLAGHVSAGSLQKPGYKDDDFDE
ncbi:hypothetical protein JCM33374_g3797 [Metschnikowia sp. JCM 33374]|nr:hypothetical protein JCM33374_g3797 [Metschnikowia sp. JCM 33374]